jgi:hypothetical protein
MLGQKQFHISGIWHGNKNLLQLLCFAELMKEMLTGACNANVHDIGPSQRQILTSYGS